MTKEEALELLKNATRDESPARVNKIFTRRKFVEFMEECISAKDDEYTLIPIFELRVWQAVKNQKRPRY